MSNLYILCILTVVLLIILYSSYKPNETVAEYMRGGRSGSGSRPSGGSRSFSGSGRGGISRPSSRSSISRPARSSISRPTRSSSRSARPSRSVSRPSRSAPKSSRPARSRSRPSRTVKHGGRNWRDNRWRHGYNRYRNNWSLSGYYGPYWDNSWGFDPILYVTPYYIDYETYPSQIYVSLYYDNLMPDYEIWMTIYDQLRMQLGDSVRFFKNDESVSKTPGVMYTPTWIKSVNGENTQYDGFPDLIDMKNWILYD
jgi:hypothetical protein